jgi:aryl-alcohol dehydrogenase-like predicted oxidoreductase
MEYRQLGRTGLSLSAIGFGCGGVGGLFVRGDFDEQCAAAQIALDGGVNYFDTAAQYGDGLSEQHLGRVLLHLSASPYIGTKIRLERSDLAETRAASRSKLLAGLDRLGRERVDVCTLHTRLGEGPNELSAADVVGPVADAMRELVTTGLTGAIGFSGLGETAAIADVAGSGRFDTVQCYFNVLNQSAAVPGSPDGVAQDFDGLLQAAAVHRLGAFCIRVLAGGALSGAAGRHRLAGGAGSPMARGEEYEEDLRRAQLLSAGLPELGAASLPELALRFALGEPRLSTVLVGFSDRQQVEAILRAAELGPLSPAAMVALRPGSTSGI